jgi:hypothetical protein
MIDWHRTVKFVQDDWSSNPLRLVLETINWLANLAVALIFAVTVPDVPLKLVYPIFLAALVISIYSAVSRESFGLLMTSITIFIIDVIAYIKLIIV